MATIKQNIIKYALSLFLHNFGRWFLGFFYFPIKRAYFTDEYGRIIQYRGLNVCNAAKTSSDGIGWQTQVDFARMTDWGFNVIRLLVFWSRIEPVQGTYDQIYLNKILERIQWCGDLGISVIVDLHQDLYCSKYGNGDGFPLWTLNDPNPYTPPSPWEMGYFTDQVQNAYKNFWSNWTLSYKKMIDYIEPIFSACPNVLGLDIMNEPFSPNPKFEKTDLHNFYNQLLYLKNSFFEPLMYTSGGIASNLPKGYYGDVYAPHSYDPILHSGGTYHWWNKLLTKISLRIKRYEAYHRFMNVPLFIGEFGISQSVKGFQNYLRDFVKYTTEKFISFCYYSYDKNPEDDNFGVINDDGSENEILKNLIGIYAQKINGTNPKIKMTSNSFDLTYTKNNSDRPTEIFIPLWMTEFILNINGSGQKMTRTVPIIKLTSDLKPGLKESIEIGNTPACAGKTHRSSRARGRPQWY